MPEGILTTARHITNHAFTTKLINEAHSCFYKVKTAAKYHVYTRPSFCVMELGSLGQNLVKTEKYIP